MFVNGLDEALEVLGDSSTFAVLHNYRNERISPREAERALNCKALIAPRLRWRATSAAGNTAAQLVEQSIERQTQPSSGPDEMRASPLDLVGPAMARAFLEHHFGHHSDTVEADFDRLFELLLTVAGNSLAAPPWLPMPTNRAIRRTRRKLHATVLRALADDTQNDSSPAVLYSLGAGPRKQVSASELADAMIGSALATRTIPGAAVTWALKLLAEYPDVQTQVQSSLDSDAGASGRRHPRSTCSALRNVVLEATRLYPPTWQIQRTTVQDAVIGGYQVRAGTQIQVSPYVIHRDPAVFSNPNQFQPERWITDPFPRGYLAFGAGPRACPGVDAALVTAMGVVEFLVRRWQIVEVPAHPGRLDASTVLIPDGLLVGLRPRETGAPLPKVGSQ